MVNGDREPFVCYQLTNATVRRLRDMGVALVALGVQSFGARAGLAMRRGPMME